MALHPRRSPGAARSTRPAAGLLVLGTLLLQASCAEAGRDGPPQVRAPAVRFELLTDRVEAVVDIAAAGGADGRLFLVEQAGRIWIVRDGALLPAPFLDIRSLVQAGGEQGLLGLAFHPDFPAKPYLYVDYTRVSTGQNGSAGDTVIARYRVPAATPDAADPASAGILLTIDQPASNHNGGQVRIGPDRRLYIGMGDGGGGCDSTLQGCNAQRTTTLLGKMLRLDVDQNENAAPFFGIPADNPFRTAGNPLDKVWASGLRNPWRFSFDRATGDLYIGDVGQGDREEISRQSASSAGGENYGWPIQEGFACHTCPNTLPNCPQPVPACDDPRLVDPIHDYSDGSAVIGGFVYRGTSIPSLAGLYVFGDLSNGKISALDPASGELFVLARDAFGITTFGEDGSGELYVAYGGAVYRLVDDGAPGPTAASTSRRASIALGALLPLTALALGPKLRRRGARQG